MESSTTVARYRDHECDMRQSVVVQEQIAAIKKQLLKDEGHRVVLVQDKRRGKGKMVPRCMNCKRSPKQRGICTKMDIAIANLLSEKIRITAETERYNGHELGHERGVEYMKKIQEMNPAITVTVPDLLKIQESFKTTRYVKRNVFGRILEDFKILRRIMNVVPGDEIVIRDRFSHRRILRINLKKQDTIRFDFGFAPKFRETKEEVLPTHNMKDQDSVGYAVSLGADFGKIEAEGPLSNK